MLVDLLGQVALKNSSGQGGECRQRMSWKAQPRTLMRDKGGLKGT